MKILILTLFSLFFKTTINAYTYPSRTIASIPHEIRIDHAKELLGSSYKKSRLAKLEKNKTMEENIYKTIKGNLPRKYKTMARAITITIIKEANHYKLDPYFVMAIISGESSFNPLAVGPVGEIGLMQLRPSTAEWVAKKAKFEWKGINTLRDPISNIKLGTFYISWLRSKFSNHSQLYLAAYNMGPASVKRALRKNIKPKDYSLHVMKRYLGFYKNIQI